MSIKCPKRYGSYDVSSSDCEYCGRGLLYQLCLDAKNDESMEQHLACHGWNDEHGQPHCCKCYEKKQGCCACGLTKEEVYSGISHTCKRG